MVIFEVKIGEEKNRNFFKFSPFLDQTMDIIRSGGEINLHI